jgi:4-diphosphocytidyl-2-C-methyl-D-erythritol kinase
LPDDTKNDFGYFSKKELHALCAQLGSDLNFCLEGGCQLATGRGEILEKLPFQEFSLSLIKPKNLGISAKEAYTKLSDLKLQSKSDLKQQGRSGIPARQHESDNALIAIQLKNKTNLNMTKKLVKALKKGNADIDDFLQNDLEFALVEDYKELQAIRMEYPEALMSGSGSTFFILEHNISKQGVSTPCLNEKFWIKSGLKSIPHGVCEN